MKVFLSLFISLKSKKLFSRGERGFCVEPLKQGWDGGGTGQGGISPCSLPHHKRCQSQTADKRPEPRKAWGGLQVSAVSAGVWVLVP